jgi:hypothetical protein
VKRFAAGGRGESARRRTDKLLVVALWRVINGRCGGVAVDEGTLVPTSTVSLIAGSALSLDDLLSSESGSDSQAHGIGELPLLREDLSLLHLSTDRASVSFDSHFASAVDSACEVGGEGCR